MKTRMLFTICAALLAAVAMAEEKFAYQSVLQNSAGVAMGNQTPSVTFKLYGTESGGNALWGRKATVSTDENGLFNIELSDSLEKVSGLNGTLDDAFAATIKKGKDLYIGLTINAGSEIVPRQKVLSVPLAAVAKAVRKADGNFAVGGSVTFGGAATFKNETKFAGGVTLAGDTEFRGTATFEKGFSMTRGATGTMPVGAIVLWWGDETTVPRGWHPCNGRKATLSDGSTYQTPDLRNRIPIGADSTYPFGEAKGEANVTLTVDTMPSHDHRFPHNINDATSHGFKRDGVAKEKEGFEYDSDKNLTVYLTKDYGSGVSGGQPHDNMPPYTALYYIIRVQ